MECDEETQLYNVLKEFAELRGKSFIRYGEQKELHRAVLDKQQISKHVAMVQKFRDIKSNMSFTEKQCISVLGMVFDDLHTSWNVKAQAKDDWVLALCYRLRNMCYTTQKALSRTPVPRWLQKLGLNADADGGNDEVELDPNADADGGNDEVELGPNADAKEDKFVCGWNVELNLGYRQEVLADGKLGVPELALPIVPEDLKSLAMSDSIWVTFKDGSREEIKDLTRERYEG